MKSKKIKIGVVGLGVMGCKHIDAINKVDEAELIALADVKKKKLNNINKKINFYYSIQELFEKEVLDGVIISTPNSCHVKDGLEAIKNNCPLLIEKPITINSKDTLTLINKANKKKVKILVGHHRRHNPIIKKAFELIKKNEIGKVRTVHIHCQMYKPDKYFQDATWKQKEGAGPIFVNLIHDLDLMNYLFGDIKNVFAHTKKSIRGYDNEDVSGAVLEFKKGIVGTLLLSDSVSSPWSWELTSRENEIYPFTGESCYFIGGTLGSLALPNLTIWKYAEEPHWFKPIKSISIPVDFSDPLVNQIKHFVEIIKTKEKPIVTPQIANKSIKVIEAIKMSSKKKKLVEI